MDGVTRLSEDELAARFGAEVVGAVLALDPGEEPPEEHRQRLAAAQPWVRTVALALEVERLRAVAGGPHPGYHAAAHVRRIEELLPLFADPAGAQNQGLVARGNCWSCLGKSHENQNVS